MQTVGGNDLMTFGQVAAACDVAGCLRCRMKPRVAVDSA